MSETINIRISPHPDIELGNERSEIEAFLTFPESGLNSETGIIMVLTELGEAADTDYQTNQLRPYLANKLNCIAIGVNYFGIFRNSQIQIRPSFLHNINRIYGLELSFESFAGAKSGEDIYRIIAGEVIKLGVTSLDLRCQPHLLTGRGEYQSWGFLPAIDCLQVLGEVLQRYDINKKKILAYGKHYGGYIASLMGKYAPRVFSAIIDWEGYSRTELRHVVSGELIEADYLFHFDLNNGVKFYIASACNNPWTIEDETSPSYFSDSHRKIRSLLCEEHRKPSETCYYIFHSEDDLTSSIAAKDRCVEILQRYNPVNYQRIAAGDSSKFNSVEDIFEWLLQNDQNCLQKENTDTDFSLNSIYDFVCGDKIYRFSYAEDGGIKVNII
ncbi:DUF2920 family protein [Syntrophomonas palmitatica]|uniref:DUF2920 family protein n=1 Tax=Syntrophomonas palmitatica TaxID=402877 RepID=UPI0006D2B983|nr:DUF2920 family protein [Syntrophomonas palmitatica]